MKLVMVVLAIRFVIACIETLSGNKKIKKEAGKVNKTVQHPAEYQLR